MIKCGKVCLLNLGLHGQISQIWSPKFYAFSISPKWLSLTVLRSKVQLSQHSRRIVLLCLDSFRIDTHCGWRCGCVRFSHARRHYHDARLAGNDSKKYGMGTKNEHFQAPHSYACTLREAAMLLPLRRSHHSAKLRRHAVARFTLYLLKREGPLREKLKVRSSAHIDGLTKFHVSQHV